MALKSSIPVLRAENYPQTRDFFLKLGFEIAEEGGDPPRFGIFRRDAATVFVDAWAGADAEPSSRWSAYFHTDDLDAFLRQLDGTGIEHSGPEVTSYGMREALIFDPDGNRLCFGQDA